MRNELLQYELIETDKLIPYVNNSRVHSDEQISKVMASIKEFGFLNPILISNDKVIIAGHCRLIAAQRLGIEKVPCIRENYLSDAQRKAYVIADNKLALDSSWDEEMLKVEIESLQGEDFNVELTGFEPAELDKILGPDGEDIKDDDFDIDAELAKPTVTREGDIWTIGRHRLLCGDSTDPANYILLMQDKKTNLVVTDPPYNVHYEAKAGSIKNDDMETDKFHDFLLAAFKNLYDYMACDASIYVFHADTEGLNFRKAFDEAGFYLSGCCIWKKPSLVLGRSPYQWQHEPCLFGWKKDGKHQWYADRKQTTIWEFEKPKKNDVHPTMKPIPLIAYCIMNSSMSNTLVLDPFLGSGTTLMACQQSERTCYGLELDPKYCDVIVRRYIELTGSEDEISVERAGETLSYQQALDLVPKE